MKFFLQTLVAVYFFSISTNIDNKKKPTDFLGTWKFSEYKSDPNTNMPKRVTFDQRGDTLFIDRLEKNDQYFAEPVLLDGRKFKSTTTSGRKKVGEARWSEDKRSFIEQAELYNTADTTKIDFLVTEQWSLAADGKELMLVTLLNVGGQTLQSKAVYDKQ
jgi:hypothetical protein